MTYPAKEYAVNIDDCLNVDMHEPDDLHLLYLGHCATYGRFQRFYNVLEALID